MVVAAAFIAGYFSHTWIDGPRADFPLLAEAYTVLKNHALEELPQGTKLEYGMIHGMVQAYADPYTVFIEPAQHELQSNDLQGEFGGVGVRIERDAEGQFLLYPFPETPATEAGIQDGDRLVEVDGMPVVPDTEMDAVVAALRGPVGESVIVTVVRTPTDKRLEFTLKRTKIPLPSVVWNLDSEQPLLGVLKVNLFADSTPAELQKGIEELQQRGATHFVLDLRDNRGGLLTAGIESARLFLEQGTIIEQQYRGREVEDFEVEKPGRFADLPLAALINSGTASAAEILVGALQAHQRAILVGRPSFGKDTIQLVFELRDNSSIHVTSARWWIPGLEPPIRDHGLQPDILLPEDASDPRPEMQAVIEALFSGE